MNRAMSSAIAATLALGVAVVPSSFAATQSTATHSYTMVKKQILLNGKVVSQPMGFAALDQNSHVNTTYMPVWYVLYVLQNLGIKYTWDGKNHLNILPPSNMKVDTTNINPGKEPLQISINGTLVVTGFSIAAMDPYTKRPTTFVPVWYVKQALNRLGITSSWDGTHWGLDTSGVQNVVSSLTIAGNQTVAQGTGDQLTVSATDGNGVSTVLPANQVQWSLDDNADAAISTTGNFIASKAGNYTVTATYEGVSQTFKILVYGPTAAVNLTTTGNLVANGVSTQTVTVTAQDASGNTVLNENGSVIVSDDQGLLVTGTANGANTLGNQVTVTLKNGVGTVDIQAPKTADVTDNLSVNGLSDASAGATINYGKLSVKSVAQVATSLQVTQASPNQYLVATTSGNKALFDVTVDDQAGQPMLSGTYTYNIQVAGAGSYSGAATGVYTAGQALIPIEVDSRQGVDGTVTVTASATGLTTGTATIQAIVPQTAVKLNVTPATGSSASFAEGGTTTFDLAPVDKNGYDTSFPSGLTVYVTNGQTPAATAANITVNGTAMTDSGVALGSNQTIQIGDTTNGADAGNYNVTIKDAAGNVFASFPVTETAAVASKLSLNAADTEVGTTTATTTLTLAFTDAYGNSAVPAANSSVTVTATGGQGQATINGQDAAQGVSLTPDKNGVMTATFTAQPYAGSVWTISAASGSISATPITVSVLNSLVANATVGVTDAANTTTANQAAAGDALKFTFGAKDTYGNAYAGSDVFAVTYPTTALIGVNGGTAVNGVTTVTGTLSQLATDFANAKATLAGNLTIQIADENVSKATAGSTTINVVPGAFSKFEVFNAQNQEITSTNELAVPSIAPVQVYLKPVDAYGNLIDKTAAVYTVDLSDNGGNGSFLLSQTGNKVQQVIVPAGTQADPVYYVNTSGNYNLSAQVSTVDATKSSVAMGTFTPFVAATNSATATNGTGTLTVVLKDQNGYPITGEAANLTGSAGTGVAGVNVGAFTEDKNNPGTYTATVTSTANVQNVVISVTDGSTTVGQSAAFNS